MLRALNDYYECLCEQENSPLVKKGYSKVAVNLNMVLTKEGELKAILPYTKKVIVKKKEKDVPREEIFPFRNSIGGIFPETIDHREKYLFGVEWDKEEKQFILGKSSVVAFHKNKEKILEFLEDIHSPIVDSYKKFLEYWVPEEQLEHEVLKSIGAGFHSGKFVISLENDYNHFLHHDKKVLEKWDKVYQNKSSEDVVRGQCCISGKKDVGIVRLHTKLKGIKDGQTSGCGLVSFNNTAFESYGKKQSYNSFVSEEVMENYTTAFNYLSSSMEHKQFFDEMTILFFAMTNQNETPYIQTFSTFMGINIEPIQIESHVDANIEQADTSLKKVFYMAVAGIESDVESFQNYEDVDFYIMGMKPNSSRLSVKFFYKNKFGDMMKHIHEHHLDMQLNETDKQIPIWVLKNELKSPVSNKDNLPPDLNVKLFDSILNHKPYPRYLLYTAIYRMKVDQDNDKKKFVAVNRKRVRIMKACLTRLNIIKKEDFCMLNIENKESAYNCGRLFAVLEMIQRNALGKNVNATIKDKFFSSACSTPYLAFPRLLKLTQNHLGKMTSEGTKIYYEKMLAEIMGNLGDTFPKALNMEKQGMFILGYYQQKEVFFTKKTTEENEEETIDENKGE